MGHAIAMGVTEVASRESAIVKTGGDSRPTAARIGKTDSAADADASGAGEGDGGVIAWRIWILQRIAGRYVLRSTTQFDVWRPGELMTDARHCGGKLDEHNTSGVYAFKHRQDAEREMRELARSYDYVLGSVLLTGDVIEHEMGFRAEFARISSLDAASSHNVDLEAVRRTYL